MLCSHYRATALAAFVLCLALPAYAEQVTHGFDNVSAPGPFHFIVPGLDNGPTLNYDRVRLQGGVILTDALFGNSASSGDNILATCDTCGLGDNPPSGLPGLISGRFTADVEAIECDVYNGVAQSATFTLTARDDGGSVIATDSVVCGPFGSPSFDQHLSLAVPGIRSFTVTTNLPTGYTLAIDTLQFTVSEGTWTDLGHGLAGSLGEPVLTGTGTLIGGDPMSVDLTNSAPGAPAFLILGFSQLDFSPFYGGTLVPDLTPPGFLMVLVTNGSGGVSLPATWPNGLPSGFSTYLQYWIEDASGPFGFTASNGLRAATP